MAQSRRMLSYTASEKTEKKLDSYKIYAIPSPTSLASFALSWTAKHYFCLCEPTQRRGSHLVDTIFQEGWQRSNYLIEQCLCASQVFIQSQTSPGTDKSEHAGSGSRGWLPASYLTSRSLGLLTSSVETK